MAAGNATNLLVLVSEGTVISAFFIDGLRDADHLWDKAWICEEDAHVEEACFRLASFGAGRLRLQNFGLVSGSVSVELKKQPLPTQLGASSARRRV